MEDRLFKIENVRTDFAMERGKIHRGDTDFLGNNVVI